VSIAQIASDKLTAEITSHGAELVRLTDGRGRELLWDGDPRWWTGRSPLLFPIVGKVPNDRVQIGGQQFEMPQHGFARTADFMLADAHHSMCTFALKSSADTLRRYPFTFTLRATYRIAGPELTVSATIVNESAALMPMSFGFHPAFRWPLAPTERREDYEIRFEADEPAPIRRAVDGLLIAEPLNSPVEGRVLRLRDDLFEDGAVIFDALSSRSVTYGSRGCPTIRISFRGLPHLGIWTKPGAPFVCIEPWQGHAAPVGFGGELLNKPGIVGLTAGEAVTYEMTVELLAD
jgi:galactose mutarotase-like enzyme